MKSNTDTDLMLWYKRKIAGTCSYLLSGKLRSLPGLNLYFPAFQFYVLWTFAAVGPVIATCTRTTIFH